MGTTVDGDSGDGGPATLAQLREPYDVVCDANGHLFIADGTAYKIRRVELAGAPTRFQPDAAVGRSLSKQKGTATYNGAAIGQTQTIRGRKKGATFYFTVSDGVRSLFTDRTLVGASKGNRKVRATYRYEGGNVTSQMATGAYDLGTVDGQAAIQVKVKPRGKKPVKKFTSTFTSRSLRNPASVDAAKAKVKFARQ
ncbi:MAG: hypothetical protein AAGC68_09700 [Verrucomicrobiota bacterium]